MLPDVGELVPRSAAPVLSAGLAWLSAVPAVPAGMPAGMYAKLFLAGGDAGAGRAVHGLATAMSVSIG